jgi:hypothetical protein
MEECFLCCCCEKKHDQKEIHEIEIKGETKKFCSECVTAIKGFI